MRGAHAGIKRLIARYNKSRGASSRQCNNSFERCGNAARKLNYVPIELNLK
jgi:hypothetical protein